MKAVNAGVDSDLGTNVYAGQLVNAVKGEMCRRL